MYSQREAFLLSEIRRLERELEEARLAANRTQDLLANGEALRQRMMWDSICNGSFNSLYKDATEGVGNQ